MHIQSRRAWFYSMPPHLFSQSFATNLVGCSAFIQKWFWVMTFENMQALNIRIEKGTIVMEQKPKVRSQGNFTLEDVNFFGRDRLVLRCSDSACLLIHLVDQGKLVLVRQPRESMIVNGFPGGHITELTAGRFDREEDVKTLLAREASEEAGTTITPEQIELVNFGSPVALSAGILDEMSWMGYVEITNDQIDPTSKLYGLAEEGESIERFFLPVSGLNLYVCEDARTFGMLQWFKNRLLEQKIDELTRMIESATATTGRE
jgi:8-oxo-dGTP pyrophosphatase MutT (NUDIX family)